MKSHYEDIQAFVQKIEFLNIGKMHNIKRRKFGRRGILIKMQMAWPSLAGKTIYL